jgi:putative sterol carrier protein
MVYADASYSLRPDRGLDADGDSVYYGQQRCQRQGEVNAKVPYPSEHAARLKEPDKFQDDSFVSQDRKATEPESVKGKIYRVILGKLIGESTLTEQAYRYPTDDWTEEQARAHAKAHSIENFEAATGEKKNAWVEMADGKHVPCSQYIEEEPVAKAAQAETTDAEVTKSIRILRIYPKEQKVMSVVYAPDVPDSYDEFMTAEEIRKAADFYMANHQNVDEMHDMVSGVGIITQSFIARANDADGFPAGAWVVEVKITNEEVWKKILSGEYKAFSFAGSARLSGKTKELESAWVDENGQRTSPYDKAA